MLLNWQFAGKTGRLGKLKTVFKGTKSGLVKGGKVIASMITKPRKILAYSKTRRGVAAKISESIKNSSYKIRLEVDIEIKIDNGVKTINGRNWQEIFDDISDAEVDVELLQQIFNNTNSDQELIREFKKLNSTHSPVSILFYLKLLTQGSIADVNDYFQKIIEP